MTVGAKDDVGAGAGARAGEFVAGLTFHVAGGCPVFAIVILVIFEEDDGFLKLGTAVFQPIFGADG